MKHSVSILASLALMTFAGAAVAGGKQLKNEGANFRLEIPPSNWVEAHRGEVLAAETTDRTMFVEVVGHPSQTMTLRAAGWDTGAAAAHLGRSLGEVKLSGEVKELHHNRMPCVEYAGSAKSREGKSVDFVALTCKTADSKGVTAVMFATPDGMDRHRVGARVIFDSLRPIR